MFARHDLTRDPPLANIDVVSCRNLLIYLTADLQRRVIPLLHYALRPGGFLVLGRSESLGRLSKLFDVVDGKQRVFARKLHSSPAGAFVLPAVWPDAGARRTAAVAPGQEPVTRAARGACGRRPTRPSWRPSPRSASQSIPLSPSSRSAAGRNPTCASGPADRVSI